MTVQDIAARRDAAYREFVRTGLRLYLLRAAVWNDALKSLERAERSHLTEEEDVHN